MREADDKRWLAGYGFKYLLDCSLLLMNIDTVPNLETVDKFFNKWATLEHKQIREADDKRWLAGYGFKYLLDCSLLLMNMDTVPNLETVDKFFNKWYASSFSPVDRILWL